MCHAGVNAGHGHMSKFLSVHAVCMHSFYTTNNCPFLGKYAHISKRDFEKYLSIYNILLLFMAIIILQMVLKLFICLWCLALDFSSYNTQKTSH